MSNPNCVKSVTDAYDGAPLEVAKEAFIAAQPLPGPEASVTKMYACSVEDCAVKCGILTVGGVFTVNTVQGLCAEELSSLQVGVNS